MSLKRKKERRLRPRGKKKKKTGRGKLSCKDELKWKRKDERK